MEAPEESMTTAKPKWYQALPSQIHTILEEFDDVFPQDLSLGLPPLRQGHEFRIDLEDDLAPTNHPFYKMSLLEVKFHTQCNAAYFKSVWCTGWE